METFHLVKSIMCTKPKKPLQNHKEKAGTTYIFKIAKDTSREFIDGV